MRETAYFWTLRAAGLALAMGWMLLAVSGYSQGTGATAILTGRVTDQSGAVVPGVKIEIREAQTGARRETVTNADGYYVLGQVPAGTYRLTSHFPGFSDVTIQPVVLQVGQTANINMTVKPGQLTQQITVSGASLRLESQTSELSQVLTNTEVKQLPTMLDNAMELVAVMPGVTASFVQGTPGSTPETANSLGVWASEDFEAGGAQRASAIVLIDGVDARLDHGGGDSVSVVPSTAEVQEFKLDTNNYSAQYGRGAGVVSIVTKSGTNSLHGSAYEYFQNTALNANQFFNNARGLPNPQYHRNQFGGAVGGPVYIPKLWDGRNKTWFFVNVERMKQSSPATIFTRVPTAAEESGDFSNEVGLNGQPITIYNPFDTYVDPGTGQTLRQPFPNNQIPPNLISSFAQNLLKFYPQPNRPGGQKSINGLPTQINNFVENAPSQFIYNRYDFRVDQQFGTTHHLMGRWTWNPASTPFVNSFGNAASPSGGYTGSTQSWNAATVSDTWSVSPTLVINQAVGFFNQESNTPLLSEGFNLASLGGPFANPAIGNWTSAYGGGSAFPYVTVGGYSQLGYNTLVSGSGSTRSLTYNLDFSKQKGPHEVKWGFQSQYRSPVGSGQAGTSGEYDFSGGFTNGPNPLLPSVNTGNGLGNLLLGLPTGGSIVSKESTHYYSPYLGWYVQDNWRLMPKLTLNLGVRYDFELPFVEANNHAVVFDPNKPSPLGNMIGPNTNGETLNQFLDRTLMGGYVFAGSPDANGQRRLIPNDWTQLSPRFGFSYQLTPKTVMRGGIAKLYILTVDGAAEGSSPSINPFLATTNIVGTVDGIHPNVTIDNPFPGGLNVPVGAKNGLLTDVGQPLSGGTGGQVNPYTWQWNFGFQREITANSLLSVAYAGNRARRLPCPFFACGDELDQATIAQYGPTLFKSVPNPFYGIITDPTAPLSAPTVQEGQLLKTWPQFAGGSLFLPPPQSTSNFGHFNQQYPFKSNWNALEVSFEHRYSHGLQMLVAYTYSKNITNADSFEGGYLGPVVGYQNLSNMNNEMSLAASDVTHRLVISHVYDLPFGRGRRFGSSWNPAIDKILGHWQLSGIITLSSGFPLPINTTPNNTGAFFGNARPNIIGEPTLTNGPLSQRLTQWLSPSAFAQPAPFTFGDAPRTLSIRADPEKNWDLSLIKLIPIKEYLNAEFRAEFFNVFNRPQFGAPDTTFGSSSFGGVFSTANSARVIQMVLKINF